MTLPTHRGLGSIVAIDVTDLFGRYSYPLRFPDVVDAEQHRLMLLYGDNGAGKTTVLRLVWNLLSPAPTKGHRSFISRTPFKLLRLKFSRGVSITVEKVSGLVGPFTLEVRSGRSRPIIKLGYDTLSDHSIRNELIVDLLHEESEADEKKARRKHRAHGDEQYLEFLAAMEIQPLFLADDRRLHSDMLADSDESELTFDEALRRSVRDRITLGSKETAAAVTLDASIRGATDVLRRVAIGAQRSGTESGHNVYLDVLKQMTKRPSLTERESYREIVQGITELGRRNERCAEFELVPPFDSEAFIKALEKIPRTRRDLAVDIAVPFVESLESRLNALGPAEQLIREFLNQSNQFLRDKKTHFKLSEGITVRTTDENALLSSSSLSSGERHLLFLLCSTLIAREHSKLFIIDEPELSLNVKWQRSVLQSLLRLTEGTNVQFIAATHSIEMISRNKPSLVRLEGR